MPTVEETLATFRVYVEQESAKIRAQMQARLQKNITKLESQHTANMKVIHERAMLEMENGVERLLAQYEERCRNSEAQRLKFRSVNPKVTELMEKSFKEEDEFARKRCEQAIQHIRDIYKETLGLE